MCTLAISRLSAATQGGTWPLLLPSGQILPPGTEQTATVLTLQDRQTAAASSDQAALKGSELLRTRGRDTDAQGLASPPRYTEQVVPRADGRGFLGGQQGQLLLPAAGLT